MYGLAADVRLNPVLSEHAALLKNFGGVWRGERCRYLFPDGRAGWALAYLPQCQKAHRLANTSPIMTARYRPRRKSASSTVLVARSSVTSRLGSPEFPQLRRAHHRSFRKEPDLGKGFNAWLIEFCERVGLGHQGDGSRCQDHDRTEGVGRVREVRLQNPDESVAPTSKGG